MVDFSLTWKCTGLGSYHVTETLSSTGSTNFLVKLKQYSLVQYKSSRKKTGGRIMILNKQFITLKIILLELFSPFFKTKIRYAKMATTDTSVNL